MKEIPAGYALRGEYIPNVRINYRVQMAGTRFRKTYHRILETAKESAKDMSLRNRKVSIYIDKPQVFVNDRLKTITVQWVRAYEVVDEKVYKLAS